MIRINKITRLPFFITLTLLLCSTLLQAKISLTATAPSAVVEGQQFRLVYSVNSDARDLKTPALDDQFDVLMGPSTSRSSSYQIINGRTTSETQLSFTYMLVARKQGTFTIPAATIVADDQKLSSNSVTIKVLPPDAKAPDSQQSSGSAATPSSNQVNSDNLFVVGHVSKSKVYEQEHLVVTYKLYTRLDFDGFENFKFPEFKDFLAQEIDLGQPQLTLENYKGKNYNTAIFKQTILYPQRTGQLTIEPAKFDVVVRVPVQRQQRSFFDFGTPYEQVRKTLTTSAIKINVQSLPTPKPSSFDGAVGRYTLNSSISTKQLKANEAVTIKLAINGSGNIKLISTPEIKFPVDFEIYDPKVDNKINTTSSGTSGSKTIEYLAIPRHAGRFTIPAVEIAYFDLASGSYKTLRSEEYTIDVAKSDNVEGTTGAHFSNKEELKFLGKDIRFLKQDRFDILPFGHYLLGIWSYWLSLIIPLILFVILVIIFRKRIKENANLSLVRNKKANKMAQRRLKKAYLFMQKQQKEPFYEEVIKALWGYLSDKLTMPISDLSKENVESELIRYHIDQPLIDQFMDILNSCEFARYAPAQMLTPMSTIYSDTIAAIEKMEQSMSKSSSPKL